MRYFDAKQKILIMIKSRRICWRKKANRWPGCEHIEESWGWCSYDGGKGRKICEQKMFIKVL